MTASGFRLEPRQSIECTAVGHMIWIRYGDARVGITERVVFVESVFEALGDIYVDGFCCLRGELRTFRLAMIHIVDELPEGACYQRATKWLASHGADIELYQSGDHIRCRLVASGKSGVG